MGSIHISSEPGEGEHGSEAEPVPGASDRDGKVVARTGRARYHTRILADGHALVADEPASAGGTDSGPNPYRLLAAALGACISITLRMYADRKQWPLEEIRVEVEHRKIKAGDAAATGSRGVLVDELRSRVALEGALDEEQLSRLMEIAHRCPVHRTLEKGAHLVMTPWQGSETEVGGNQPGA